jgi:Trypsin
MATGVGHLIASSLQLMELQCEVNERLPQGRKFEPLRWTFPQLLGALLVLGLICLPTLAIVVRHDVADAKCRVSDSVFPPLVELPGEGQGVLISSQWVVTAAHAVTWRPIHEVTINGISRPVAEVIVHPGYKPAPKKMESGEAEPLMAFKAAADDIALIRLENPVSDVAPARLYRGDNEVGKVAEILGRGATDNGLVGEYPNSPHRGDLLSFKYCHYGQVTYQVRISHYLPWIAKLTGI